MHIVVVFNRYAYKYTLIYNLKWVQFKHWNKKQVISILIKLFVMSTSNHQSINQTTLQLSLIKQAKLLSRWRNTTDRNTRDENTFDIITDS